MANANPMSLKFDTELDNKGFEKGSSELQKALQSLREKFIKLSGDMSGAFDLKTFGDNLKNISRGTEDFERDLMELRKTMESIDMTDTFIQAESRLALLTKMVEEFGRRTYTLEDGTVVVGKQSEQYDYLTEALTTLREKIDEVDESQKSTIGNYEDINFYVDEFRETIEKISDNPTWEETAAAIKELKRQMEELGGHDFEINGETLSGKSTEAYRQMGEAVGELEGRLDSFSHSAAWSQMEENYQKMPTLSDMVSDSTQNAFSKMEQAVTQASFNLKQAIDNPIGAMDKFGLAAATAAVNIGGMVASNVIGFFISLGAALAQIPGKIAQMGIDRVVKGLKSLGSAALGAAKNLAKLGINTAANALKKVNGFALNAAKSLGKMVASKITNGMRSLASNILGVGRNAKAMGRQATMSFKQVLSYAVGIGSLAALFGKLRNAVQEGFSKILESDPALAQTVNNMKASVEQLKVSFAAAFLPLIQIVLPVINTIINALSKAVSYIGMFIAALTGQKTYKAAVAGQNAVAGAADNAADSYNNAAKAAKEEQKTVASFDELHQLAGPNDNSSGGGGGGGGNGGGYSLQDMPVASDIDDLAKKLKEMWDLADFTELGKKLGEGLKRLLESIPWDKIKEIARKLGKSLATLLNGFMEVPGLFELLGKTLAEGINTIFELLNAFVTNLHWDSLGRAIKDFVLGLLNNIDWPLIFDTFAKLGAGIGTALEEALDNPEIWTAIFTTISNVIKSLLLLIYNLFDVPNWASIAQNIGIGLNQGIEEFPWELLSETISTVLNAFFDFAYNLLTTFDFKGAGAHIGQSIMDAITGTDWATGAAAFAAFINGLYDFLNGIWETVEWGELGGKVIEAIAGFFNEIDFSKWSEWVSNIFIALFDFLTGAVEEVDWANLPDNILAKIGEFMDGFDWEGIGTALTNLFDALSTALKEIDWASIPGKIVDGISEFFSNFNWDEMADTAMTLLGNALGAAVELLVAVGGLIYEAFGNIVDGGLEGIVDALANIGTWLYDHVLTPIVDGFREVFDMHSPSEVMKPLGVDIINGIGEGIISWITGIPAWLAEHVGGPFVNGIMDLFGIGSGDPALKSSGMGVIEGMKEGMSNALSGAFEWVRNNVTGNVIDPIKEGLGAGNGSSTVTSEYGAEVAAGLRSGIEANSGNLTSAGTGLVNSVLTPIKAGFGINGGTSTVLLQYGGALVESLKNGIGNGASAVVTAVTGIAQKMMQAFQSIKWDSTGSEIISGISNGIRSTASKITDAFKNLVSGIVTLIKDTKWSDLGVTSIQGIIGGLKATVGNVINIFKEMLAAVLQMFKTVNWNAVGTYVLKEIGTGISKTVSDVIKTVDDFISKIKKAFEQVEWNKVGSFVVEKIQNGLSGGARDLANTATNIASNLFNAFQNSNWESIGNSICAGINNGLLNGWDWLTQTAWNLANNIFWAACNALGINSPSKEFQWMGEMVTEGMVKGIEDTERDAVNTAEAMAEAVVDGANGAKPVISLDTTVDGIDGVLSSFADRVTDSFAAMVARMEQIAAGSSFYVPAAAAGTLAPYGAGVGSGGSGMDVLNEILNRLTMAENQRITRGDLRDVLTDVVSEYLDISFYLGDEQVARSANRGNERINRRYKSVE